MKITKEVEALQNHLSKNNTAFMEYLKNNPAGIERSNYKTLESDKQLHKLQPWPTFIDKQRKEAISTVCKEIFHLIKKIPEKLFANDPEKMAHYYEQPEKEMTYQMAGLTDLHLDNLLSRGDFRLSPQGIKCVEYNVSTNISAWEVPLMENLYLNTPIIRRFLEQQKLHVKNENMIALILDHIIAYSLTVNPGNETEINIALVAQIDTDENTHDNHDTHNTHNNQNNHDNQYDHDNLVQYIEKLYKERLLRLKNKELTGSLYMCDFHQLETLNDTVYYKGKKIHALLETYNGLIPARLVKAFAAGNIRIIDGPVTGLMSNKFNLALLSENENSPTYSLAERETIKKHIPWTRKLGDGQLEYGTKKIKSPDYIISNKDRFVIKPSVGLGGQGVYVGKYTSEEEWNRQVNIAVSEKKWLVQEWVDAHPGLYQAGENGSALHELIWGFFMMGSQYIGGFLRVLLRTGSEGVVNADRGAEISPILEVSGREEYPSTEVSRRRLSDEGERGTEIPPENPIAFPAGDCNRRIGHDTKVENYKENPVREKDGSQLIEKFEEQVERTPDNLAVGTPAKNYTYRQLNNYSNRIARMIMQTGTGDTVGLLFPHGVHMIAAILGALKARKIYVPLSVDYPRKRLAYMLEDSGASLLITESGSKTAAQELCEAIPLLVIDKPHAPLAAPRTGTAGGNSKNAYILYTSGSTGNPKGVVQTHENADYYTRNWIRRFSITAADRMTLFTSFCHDGSVQDMFSALHTGAALYPFNLRDTSTGSGFREYPEKAKITIWHSVPSLFSYFTNALPQGKTFPGIRFVLLGGEPVREHEVEKLKKHFPGATMANVYGQTESSVNTISLIEQHQPYSKTLIGTPLDETEIFVVNDEGEEVDTLEVGEILVGCKYISPGYWKKPGITAKVFLPDDDYGTIYCTGDLGRPLPDGGIEYLGRKDAQMKIRGFRVEPGEIETRLLKHNAIKEAIVLPKEEKNGDNTLCAYFVPQKPDDTLQAAQLRQFTGETLPDYMIPTYYMQLCELPLTPGGKINRRALPTPELKTETPYKPPETDLEETVVKAWQEVLQLEKVGIHDNFFDLGGNSLNLILVNDKLEEQLNLKIPVTIMFKYPTIDTLSHYLRKKTGKAPLETTAEEQTEPEDQRMTTTAPDPEVAVIGMSCKLPGANNIHRYLENLKNGTESITFFSKEELEEAGVEARQLEDPGYVRAQASIENPDYFDAAFFDYTPMEAMAMDPQIRVFHETVWEALENAGYTPDPPHNGTNGTPPVIGLYAGATSGFYWQALALLSGRETQLGDLAAESLTNRDFLSTRIAYKLNLRGPANMVQT
ncbi:MAG: amino acid adenylation domain-containing protein, partial [bacterium]|nr:amino acid adenylation domain-containing protein [bacterium]